LAVDMNTSTVARIDQQASTPELNGINTSLGRGTSVPFLQVKRFKTGSCIAGGRGGSTQNRLHSPSVGSAYT
jgi:hypothetical protein